MVWKTPEVEAYDLSELASTIKAKAYSYYQHYEMLNWANSAPVGSTTTFYNVTLQDGYAESVQCKLVCIGYSGPVLLMLGIYYVINKSGQLRVTWPPHFL